MTLRVPIYRTHPRAEIVQAGRAVSAGSTMQPVANLANWLAGRGAQLVPACSPNTSVSAGSSKDYYFYTEGQPANTRLVWTLTLRSTGSAATQASVVVTTPVGGSSTTHTVIAGRGVAPVKHYQDLSAKPTGPGELSIRIAPAATGTAIRVEQIACRALPRFDLDPDTTDYGVHVEKVGVNAPIYVSTVGDLVSRADQLYSIARRVGHFAFSLPDNTTDAVQVTTASPGWQALLGLEPSVLAQKSTFASLTGTLSYRVRYATTAGGAGNFRVTASSGDTDTVTLSTSTALTWTATRTIDVDCTDLTTADGLQAATPDTLTFEANQTAGTVYVAGYMFWRAA